MPPEKEKLCFVLMPFKEEMKEVYDDAIRPAIEQAGFTSLRVDELKGSFNINKKIIEFIFSSDAILADLTNWNPNVFYEMGVAHAIGNKTIMIIQKKDELPFDVKTYRCIQYEQTKLGLEQLKSHIVDHLVCIDEWQKEPTNPVQDFKPRDAFIPRDDLVLIQKQLKEAEQRLKKAVDHQQYEEKIKELAYLKKELESARQLQKVVGRKEQDFIKRIQSLTDEKKLAQNKAAELVKQIKTLKAELQKARQELQEKSEPASVTPNVTSLFRNEPNTLSEDNVKAMLKKYDFYCGEYDWSKKYCNPKGKGFQHQFESKTIKGDKVVVDKASGLMWQQSGSPKYIDYDAAKKYVDDLNKKGFAGFKDWRLPTLEEAMSLMEGEKKNEDLYIDSVFDKKQRYIWTSDLIQGAAGRQWVVDFYGGGCYYDSLNNDDYVRAVRFGQSSPE
jgi:hypothetical protein